MAFCCITLNDTKKRTNSSKNIKTGATKNSNGYKRRQNIHGGCRSRRHSQHGTGYVKMALRRPERIRGASRERGAMVEGIDADFREKTVRANVEHVNLYIYFLTRRAL